MKIVISNPLNLTMVDAGAVSAVDLNEDAGTYYVRLLVEGEWVNVGAFTGTGAEAAANDLYQNLVYGTVVVSVEQFSA